MMYAVSMQLFHYSVENILYSSKCMMYADTNTVLLVQFPIKMKNNNTVPINERKQLKMRKPETFNSAHAFFSLKIAFSKFEKEQNAFCILFF